MGLLDFFWKATNCPECSNFEAKRFLGYVRCNNPSCSNYYQPQSTNQRYSRAPQRTSPSRPLTGNFNPGPDTIEIRYRNFRGEEKSYSGDSKTLRRVNKHISVCLAPTGKRVAFKRGSLLNLNVVESAFPNPNLNGPIPSSQEQKVLAFHQKRKSTSPLYEELRLKYPMWQK
jgi:hypothetical protein